MGNLKQRKFLQGRLLPLEKWEEKLKFIRDG